MKTLRAIWELPVVVGLCLVGAGASALGWHRLDDWCAEQFSHTQAGQPHD